MVWRRDQSVQLVQLLFSYYKTPSGQMGEILSYVAHAKSGVFKKEHRGIAAFQKLLRPSVRLSEV